MDDKTPYQKRKERSLKMAQEGIEPTIEKTGIYWIPSQSVKGLKHKVEMKPNGFCSCDCEDNKRGNLCKHIILLKFYISAKSKASEIKEIADADMQSCPYCNSIRLQRNGTRKTTMGKKQRWLCLDCSKRFVLEPVQKIKGDLDAVVMAMDLYMKGVSYRGIKDSLKQFLGLEITHVTVMNWVAAYMDRINEYVKQFHPQVSNTWHADEQMVSQKGSHKWVWNCLDGETRFLLANHVSPLRTTEDARQLFRDAKETAQSKAQTVITDGAFAYNRAITHEFWTYSNRYPHQRYVNLKQKTGNNNKLERYHGTFRQRDKVMKGFKTDAGTENFTRNFKTYYNFVKPHGTLGTTPAKASGIQESSNWKDLLVKSLSEQPKINS